MHLTCAIRRPAGQRHNIFLAFTSKNDKFATICHNVAMKRKLKYFMYNF